MMAANRRRSRRQIEEEEDEEEFPHSPCTERTSLSPEVRPEKRRRTRTTTASSSTEDVSTATNDGIELGAPDENYEEEEEYEEDEEDEEIMQHTQRDAENRAQKERERAAGIEDSPVAIKSIELFNFMCHKRLEINFGERINFVIGHNGSGKSAILTALTVCLGGKANATNRASSLKNLIKEGENSATIVIKILNGGKDAYKPDLYGDVIAIERRFTKDGSTSYKLKSKSGHIVSTKLAELQEILDHIQLQVDNPMTVLTQDTARRFLGDSSSAAKYKLFMKGVQLSHLDTDYSMVEGQIATLEQTLESKTDALATLKANEQLWKAKLQHFLRSADIEQRIQMMQNIFAWVQVKDQEKVVADIDTQLEKVKAKLEEATEKMNEEQQRFGPIDLLVEQATDKQTALTREEEIAQEELKEAKTALVACTDTLKGYKDDQAEIEKRVRGCEETVRENQDKIQAVLALQDDGGERARNEARLHELEASFNKWIMKEHDAKENVQKATVELKEKEKLVTEAKSIKEAAQLNQTTLNNRLTELKKSKESRMTKFHDKMPQVLEEIQKKKGLFNQVPIGPLGSFVKIRKEEWAGVCENLFGRPLNGFLVTNYHDMDRLRSILRMYNCDVPVIVSARDKFDFSSGEPDAKYDTVLRILDISNEDVKRQFIVQNHIESTILIASREEADRVMQNGGPAKVSACYALNPEARTKQNVNCGYRISGARGGSGISPVWASNNASKLTNRSVDEQIADMNKQIETAKKEVNVAEERVKQAEGELRLARSSYRLAMNVVKEAEAEKLRVQDETEELRPKVEDVPAESGLVEAYKEAIEETQVRKQKFLEQILALRNVQQEALDKRLEAKEVQQQKKDALNALEKQRQQAEKAIREIMQERMQINLNVEHRKKQVDLLQSNLETLTATAERENRKLAEQTEGASSFCPERPPPQELNQSFEVVKRRMKGLRDQLAQMQKDANMTETEAQAKFAEAHEQYRSAAHEMDSLNKLKEVLWESHRKRKDRYFRFRKIISHKAITVFSHLMEQRGFQGKLIFDHKKMEIRVKVNPGGDGERGSRKDPKSLSGGEKSFTQICMLLSVWEAMGSPIRALDEFDVFMDAVNRKTSMAMMIEAARHSIEKQFILITPQDMGNVALGPDVRVHRMRDPERGQAVIETT